mgnify:CR=1 FL=1|jgi:hypothetical protein
MNELFEQLPLTNDLQGVNFGPYMWLADARLRIISIFDDLRFDRADLDMMSPAMCIHVIRRLAPLGFIQTSGNILRNEATGVRCLTPKFIGLEASPFDITRYHPRSEMDFYILTPTQTACQYVDNYPFATAVERVRILISRQPVNLYKISDYLEYKPSHQRFADAIAHLSLIQSEAVDSEPLKTRHALGSVGV